MFNLVHTEAFKESVKTISISVHVRKQYQYQFTFENNVNINSRLIIEIKQP